MKAHELAQLGYDTDGYSPEADYVPDTVDTDDEILGDFVYRAFLQLSQLDSIGGVGILGGPQRSQDEIHLALEDGTDIVAAVNRFGDAGQRARVSELINEGHISS